MECLYIRIDVGNASKSFDGHGSRQEAVFFDSLGQFFLVCIILTDSKSGSLSSSIYFVSSSYLLALGSLQYLSGDFHARLCVSTLFPLRCLNSDYGVCLDALMLGLLSCFEHI